MKALKLRVSALVLGFAVGAAAGVFADSPNAQKGDKYVFVTGSMIPQKVKVKWIGTKTVSPVTAYGSREFDQSGRFTTEGVLSQDPSVRIRPRPGG